jgi:hypothetical protein
LGNGVVTLGREFWRAYCFCREEPIPVNAADMRELEELFPCDAWVWYPTYQVYQFDGHWFIIV